MSHYNSLSDAIENINLTIWSLIIYSSSAIVLIFYMMISLSMQGIAYEVNSNGIEEIFIERIFLISNLVRIKSQKREIVTAYLRRRHDLPTPLFPIRSNLKR